jgi:hypothetical protein
MIKRGVHGDQPSIFLIQSIIPFRLIEHQIGTIVNTIEAGRIGSGPETTTIQTCNRHEMQLKQKRRNQLTVWHPPAPKEKEMSILSSIGRIATEFSAARARYQTERAIHSLPIELQKDIGWPEASDAKTNMRFGVGSWAGAK